MEEFTIKKKEELDPQEKSFRRRKDIIKNVIIVFLVVFIEVEVKNMRKWINIILSEDIADYSEKNANFASETKIVPLCQNT